MKFNKSFMLSVVAASIFTASVFASQNEPKPAFYQVAWNKVSGLGFSALEKIKTVLIKKDDEGKLTTQSKVALAGTAVVTTAAVGGLICLAYKKYQARKAAKAKAAAQTK